MYISEKGKCNEWQKFIRLHFQTMTGGEEVQAMEVNGDVILKNTNSKNGTGRYSLE